MAIKKAKTKTPTKKQTRKSKSNGPVAHLPNGYKVIGRAPNWDPEKDHIIEGERGPTNEVTMDAGKKSERTVRNCIVNDETLGSLTVWESGMLRDFFDQTEEGNVVRIEFLGLGKAAQKGHNPPKLFSCAVKDE